MAHLATWTLPPYTDKPEWWFEYARWRRAYNTCAECGSTKVHVENYDMMWHDGDVICENGHYVRMWDAS